MKEKLKRFNLFANPPSKPSCSGGGCSDCGRMEETSTRPADGAKMSRRQMLGVLGSGLAAVAGTTGAKHFTSSETGERRSLEWQEYFKENFRLMTDEEQQQTVARLERLAELKRNEQVNIAATSAVPGTLFGYAFNVSKCKGYRKCIDACIHENNLDPDGDSHYIRIFEIPDGGTLADGDADFYHAVPAAGHHYLGTQCFQCANPPCVDACPTGATWQEPDGIVVIDYDWCIGCRYCQAACPYWARRFNWSEPKVPSESLNKNQHYLGNRRRPKGVVEKCTFCIQRTRNGQLPACAEACPTGARIFGNLLDPNSEIRYVLAHKKVFRLKEDLGTEPRFWYFTD